MTSPQYMLSHYIGTQPAVGDIKHQLYDNFNIMTKDYPEYGLTTYYTKYDSKHKTPLEWSTRSVVMSNTDSSPNVVCYTCPSPIYNMDAIQFLFRNQQLSKEVYVCYEGSLISIFNYNDIWYAASRRNIYTSESEQNGQYKMFLEALNGDGYETFSKFTDCLDSKYTYHFVLIHHKNENVVSYEQAFGPEYKKLCFIFARDRTTQVEIRAEDVDNTFVSENIFLPKYISEEDFQTFMQQISLVDVSQRPTMEGVVIKIGDNVLKLQSASYMFHKAIGSDKNMFRGFISLYQLNTLKMFLSDTNNDKFRKIVNPLNTKESFDMIGMIDAMFKVVTSELYALFYILWDDTGAHLNRDLYNILPREYKDMLFHIKGIFYANKARFGKKLKIGVPILKMNDVYNYIKAIDSGVFEKFIRCRKLMLNWVRLENNNNTTQFTNSLHKCEKVYYKLTAIYTTKLFPEIMPDDMPSFTTKE
jgi:hypothetical protein